MTDLYIKEESIAEEKQSKTNSQSKSNKRFQEEEKKEKKKVKLMNFFRKKIESKIYWRTLKRRDVRRL